MKKIIFCHLVLIGALFLWRHDLIPRKKPLKVVTHQFVERPALQAPLKQPEQVVTQPPAPKQTKRSSPVAKSKSKQPSPQQRELAELMQQSLSSLHSSPKSSKKSLVPDEKIGSLKSLTIAYEERLVAALQQVLCFPEQGDVYLQLCVNKLGKVLSCTVLESASKVNREYVLSILPTLTLPAFQEDFKGTASQTFHVRLTSKKMR